MMRYSTQVCPREASQMHPGSVKCPYTQGQRLHGKYAGQGSVLSKEGVYRGQGYAPPWLLLVTTMS